MSRQLANRLVLLLGSILLVAQLNAWAQPAQSLTPPRLVVQSGHSDRVNSLAFSPDGLTLVTSSLDRSLKLWDVATGSELRTIHSGTWGAPAFSPDGKSIACEGSVWDVSSGAKVRDLGEVMSPVVYSPDGRLLASGNLTWDLSTGKLLPMLAGAGDIQAVAFSADNKLFATGSWDGEVKLWDRATRAEVRTFETVPHDPNAVGPHVNSVAFSRDGRILIRGRSDGTVKWWDLATGAELATIQPAGPAYLSSISLSVSGNTLATGVTEFSTDRENGELRKVKLWDLANGNLLRTIPGVTLPVFSPDGSLLAATSNDETFELWTVTGNKVRKTSGHSRAVNSIALTPDGKNLAVGSQDGTVRLWDVATDAEVRTLNGHSQPVESVGFSPDGKTLASGSLDQSVRLWDYSFNDKSQQLVKPNSGRVEAVQTLAYSHDGSMIATQGFIYNLITLWDTTTRSPQQSFQALGTALAFSPDDKLLAFGVAGAVVLRNIPERTDSRVIKVHERGIVWSVAFSPNGESIASASAGKADSDRTVKLWNVKTGAELHSFDGPTVEQLTFSPNGELLAGGGSDGVIELWNLSSGRKLRSLRGHSDYVTSLVFTADNKYLISGSKDATVRIWDVKAGRELASLVTLDQSDWLVVTPDGLFDGTPAAWNKILWQFNNNTFDHAPVETFFNEFFHPGLLRDIFSGDAPVAHAKIEQKDRRQPALELITTSDGAIASRAVNLKIAVSKAPAGAQDLRLFRNGSLVRIWPGDVLKGQTRADLQVTVPLVAGENRFTAYAFNRDDVKSADATLIVTGAASLKRQPVAYLLTVGVNQYANSQYNLKNAVADADDFATAVKHEQEKLGLFQRVERIDLRDRGATKTGIIKALKEIAARIQPEDALLIFFAGHGAAPNDHFYLIPHDLGYAGLRDDLDQAALAQVLSHSISDQELDQLLERVDASQLLLVIDACKSGRAIEPEEKRRGPMNSKGLAQLAYEKGMYILTAAESYQAALEADRLGHGYLTYALVEEGLKAGAADREPKDGVLLLREWLNYATRRVPEMQQEKFAEEAARGRALDSVIKFDDADSGRQRHVQRPRVFYRRETESQPLVMARTGSTVTAN